MFLVIIKTFACNFLKNFFTIDNILENYAVPAGFRRANDVCRIAYSNTNDPINIDFFDESINSRIHRKELINVEYLNLTQGSLIGKNRTGKEGKLAPRLTVKYVFKFHYAKLEYYKNLPGGYSSVKSVLEIEYIRDS